eukprot:3096626-Rhodomonas_salina.2
MSAISCCAIYPRAGSRLWCYALGRPATGPGRPYRTSNPPPPYSQTVGHPPRTQNPKPQTPNLEPSTLSQKLEHSTRNPGNPEQRTPNPKP